MFWLLNAELSHENVHLSVAEDGGLAGRTQPMVSKPVNRPTAAITPFKRDYPSGRRISRYRHLPAMVRLVKSGEDCCNFVPLVNGHDIISARHSDLFNVFSSRYVDQFCRWRATELKQSERQQKR